MEKWQRSLYQSNLPLGADGTKVTASKAQNISFFPKKPPKKVWFF